MLLYDETTGIEVTVEAALCGRELQNTIVGVGDSTGIVLCISLTPYHILALLVGQNLHGTFQHYGTEVILVTQIDGSFRVCPVMSHTNREGISGEIEHLYALALAWRQHGLHTRIAFLIN